jgi:rRNA processing protein Krr1/Pno1
MKLLAHNNLVGRLIGKNGATVKKIMEDTQCSVAISKYALV